MNGTIFNELDKFGQSVLGQQEWARLIEAPGLPYRSYLAINDYPDSELHALIAALSARKGDRSTAATLEAFDVFIAPKLSIMVVDDQALVRSLLTQVIKGLGCAQEHIHQAVDGMCTLRALNMHHFDAVLCNINMELMGGFDLLKEVRMGRPHVTPSTIPFVFLSGHSERQNVELALQLDADGFIVKPPRPADIEKALASAFLRARPETDPLRYSHVATWQRV